MTMFATTKHEVVTDRPGGVWRKWGVDGMTSITEDLSEATITIWSGIHRTSPDAVSMATRHEEGHADVAETITDNGGDAETFRNYDRWQNEVEAWIRGMEAGSVVLRREAGEFVLDCLNTYRRALGMSESDWITARRVIVDFARDSHIREHLLNYEPLEPDPDDAPPKCMHFGPDDPEEDGEENDEEGDDPEEGGEDEEGDYDDEDEGDGDGDDEDEEDEESEGEESEESGTPETAGATLDPRWMKGPVLAALEESGDAVAVGKAFGLDPAQMPPLVKVLAELVREER